MVRMRLAVPLALVSLAAAFMEDGAALHERLLQSCLGDDSCIRRLSAAVGNSTNGTTTMPTEITFSLPVRHPPIVEFLNANDVASYSNFAPGDVVFGMVNPMRGLLVPESESLKYVPSWQYNLLLHTAMVAFYNGLVIAPPATRAPQRIHALVADVCKTPLINEGPGCQIPEAMRMAQSMYSGSAFDGSGDFQPIRAMLGSEFAGEQLAYAAGAAKVPFIGAYLSVSYLSNKKQFPTYVRTNPSDSQTFTAMMLVLQGFQFTLVDLHVCDTGDQSVQFGFVNEQFSHANIRVQMFVYAPAPHTGFPPGTEGDILMQISDSVTREQAEVTAAAKKAQWEANVENMRVLNAHAHIQALQVKCPAFDHMHYMEMVELAGSGHFWTGWEPRWESYRDAYVMGLTVGVMFLVGFETPYRNYRGYDGFMSCEESPDTTTSEFTDFWDLHAYIGRHMDTLLDPSTMPDEPKYLPAYFQSWSNAVWSGSPGQYFADSVFAVLLGINAALVDHGTGFTNEQLLEKILALDFNGVTGRVRFSENGDRIVQIRLVQCNWPADFVRHEFGGLCELREVGSYDTALTLNTDVPFIFFGQSTTVPSDKDRACPLGQRYERVTGKCLLCEAGSYTARLGMAYCESCSPGSYSDAAGASSCRVCLEGAFAGAAGLTLCSSCSAGTFSDAVQQSECRQCPAGQYSGPGAKLCSLCDIGYFNDQKQQSQCRRCPAMLTTAAVGSISQDACICPEGTYRDLTTRDLCHPCPEGMECALGSDMLNLPRAILAQQSGGGRRLSTVSQYPIPVSLPGYMTRVDEPLRPYKCLSEGVCPGGAPGVCARRRDTSLVACAQCEENSRKTDNGACVPCTGGSDATPFALAPFVLIGGMSILVFMVNRDLILQKRAMLSLALVGAITISSLQTMSMFQSLSMSWFDPMSGTVDGLSILQFDMEILRPGCFATVDSVGLYTLRQLVPLFLIIVTLVILCLKKLTVKTQSTDIPVEFTNTVGTIFSALFISMVSASFVPFVCYKHPDDTESMLSTPEIKCWEGGDHSAIVAVGLILFILIPVPFLVLVGIGTYKFRSIMNRAAVGESRMLAAFRFLHFRFQPHAYFYSSIFMTRALLICLIPVVIREDPAFQLCILAMVILFFSVVQTKLQPWRSTMANMIEASLNAGLVLLIVCGAANSDMRAQASSIKAMGTAILIIGLIVLFLGFAVGVAKRFRPYPWHPIAIVAYARDTAAQTRMLKLMLERRGQATLTDDQYVHDLDTLFDIIRSAVGKLVVYLSRDALSRPWIAGQVAIGHAKKLPMVAITTASFVAPLEEDFEHVSGYLDLTGVTLGQFSIGWQRVEAGYRHLMSSSVPRISVGTVASRDWRDMFNFIMEGMQLRTEIQTDEFQKGQVLISVDPSDDEALATAGIIVFKCLPWVQSFMSEGFYTLSRSEDLKYDRMVELIGGSRCMLVVLSPSSLMSTVQMQALMLGSKCVDSVIVQQMAARKSFSKKGNREVSDQMLKEDLKAMGMLTSIPAERSSGGMAAVLSNRMSDAVSSRKSNEGAAAAMVQQASSKLADITGASQGAVFRLIPVSTSRFTFPPDGAYEDVFGHLPGITGHDIEAVRKIFDRVTLAVSADAAEWILNNQMQLIIGWIPRQYSEETSMKFKRKSTDGSGTNLAKAVMV